MSSNSTTPRLRFLAVLVLVVCPWVVVLSGEATFVFPFGLVSFDPLSITLLTDYLFRFTRGLPRFLLAWPIAVLLYLCALVSAATGLVDREDIRVTAGLLVFSAFSQSWVAVGFGRRLTYTALPVGAVLVAVVLWFGYADAIARLVGSGGPE